jgi:tetratricopeptide (TPR) repeat protein
MRSSISNFKFSIFNFQFLTRFGLFGRALISLCLVVASLPSLAATPETLFHLGSGAYHAGDYARAAMAFHEAAQLQPASGTLQNLGNAEWQRGRTGPAILAWEQSLWLDPFNEAAHTNLRFARKTAQLESPELAWYEVVSGWLPVNWWAWIAQLSFWLALTMVLLPGILRWRKVTWHQAVAALGFALFLLSVPAHLGVETRLRLGFILEKETPLRLTPTEEAQVITRLPAGDAARVVRTRGAFLLIHTSRASGWIKRNQIGLIAQQLAQAKSESAGQLPENRL